MQEESQPEVKVEVSVEVISESTGMAEANLIKSLETIGYTVKLVSTWLKPEYNSFLIATKGKETLKIMLEVQE